MIKLYTPEDHRGIPTQMVSPNDATEDDDLYVEYSDYKADAMPFGLSVTRNGADVWDALRWRIKERVYKSFRDNRIHANRSRGYPHLGGTLYSCKEL